MYFQVRRIVWTEMTEETREEPYAITGSHGGEYFDVSFLLCNAIGRAMTSDLRMEVMCSSATVVSA